MASVLLTAAGAAAGSALPGVGLLAGPLLGYAGGMLGGQIDSALGIVNPFTVSGRQLDTLRLQDSREGAPIARIYGTLRTAGNIIWASPLLESRSTERIGGGKGGSASATSYRYAAHIAVGVCAGPVEAVHRIWADSKVIYDRKLDTVYADAVRIYTGDSIQTPDALLESFEGSGNVPAYRGTAYVVLENLKLEHYGNRIPNLTFEVEGISSGYAPLALGNNEHTTGPAVPDWNPRRAFAVSATHCVIPGVETVTTWTRRFVVEHYSWDGSTFEQTHRATSDVFDIEVGVSAGDNFALAPDGNRLLMMCGGNILNLMLYDIAAQAFGTHIAPAFDAAVVPTAGGHVTWIDNITIGILCNGNVDSVNTIGVSALQAGGRSLAAADPLPFTGFDVDPSTFDAARFLAPLQALGTRLFAAHDTAAETLYITRLSAHNSAVQAETLPPLDISALPGNDPRILVTGQDELLVLKHDTSSTNQLYGATYAVTSAALAETRAPATISGFADLQLADAIAVAADRIILFHVADPPQLSELRLTDSGIVVSGAPAAVGGLAPAFELHGSSPFLSRLAGNTVLLTNDEQLLALTARRGDNTLAAVVDDIAALLQLSPADVDTTDLDTTPVAGFISAQQQPARRALETLQAAYPFTLTETDGVLVARLITSASATDVPSSARRASATAAVPPALAAERLQQAEVPTAVQVDYIDAAADYIVASATAARAAPPHAKVERIALPLVLNETAARQIAESTLIRRVTEAERVSFATARDYMALDVADRITLDGHPYRITRLSVQGGLISAEAVRDAAANLTAITAINAGANSASDIAVSAALHLLDLPPLSDAAGQPGMYVGATAPDAWTGGVVYRTLGDGAATEYTRLPRPLTLGYAVDTLAGAAADYTDIAHTVTVALASGSLASVTMAEALNGANLCLLGDEILHFATATLVAADTYTLSHLIRARCGTEYATGTHAAGERFVLLEPGALQFVPGTLADRGQTAHMQLLSSGQSLADALPVNITYNLETLRPFAPAGLVAVRDGASNDVALAWKRRARVQNAWLDYADVPLDESAEHWRVDILDSGDTVRSFTPVTGTQTYTAAQQTTDFGSPPAALTFRVTQISPLYGDGRSAETTITF
ncbi:MAG: phage tail protein [Bdellovibrionales bacterium]